MINLNVQFLSDAYIASVADSFLKENSVESIPVNIERIIEFNYRMDIVPIPGMLDLAETDGLCSSDCTKIYVDDFIYHKRYFRYRFTLAHELGHRVLHKCYFDKLRFSSVTQWISMIEQIDTWDCDKMEYQAYMFGGMILVPTEILRIEFKKQLRLIKSHIDQAKLNGIRREDYLPIMLDAIANELSPKFEVSRGVLSRRIRNDCLEQEIG